MPHGARCKALADWLLTTDPKQRIRMAMAGFASLLMLCCTAIVNLLAVAGLARQDWVGWWTLFTVAGLVALMVAIRSGWSLRLRDPSLTQVQIRYALVCNAAGYAILGEARGITPVILSLILMFGIFGMSPRQLAANMLFALGVFAAAFAAVATMDDPDRKPALELAYAAMVVLVLIGSTFIAVRLQHIRRRLVRQKQALTSALEQIGHLATHDELTGLVNRRRMTELMDVERQRCTRNARPLILALLDLDHFKHINDTHGHAMGDQVLQIFAVTVQNTLRSTDVLARWGGEEFVLMLYDTDPDCAGPLLDRVRQAVQAQATSAPAHALRVTVSIGLAVGEPGETVERILERADEALYQAKARGRNRVVVHGSALPSGTRGPARAPAEEYCVWPEI